jgi:Lrp/AsnC family leucine-responsive transcriptional regulator
VTAFDLHRELDRTDWAILTELQRDARLSYLALGKLVGLSGPATAERVRRLEAAGIITGYRAVVDRARVGYSVTAFVRMTCFGGRCIRTSYTPQLFPEVVELHRVNGEDCSLLKVAVASIAHLEDLIDRLARYGHPATTLVLSTVTEHLPVPPLDAASQRDSGSAPTSAPPR